MTREEMITKLDFYHEKKIAIHIDCLNGKYYNGLIIEIGDKLLVLLDRVVGEMPIPLSEIDNVEKYRGDL